VLPLKPKVHKPLLGLPRRHVGLSANLLKQKLRTQLHEHRRLIVSNDIKAAALRRAIQRKRRQHNCAARMQSPSQRRHVSLTALRCRQEVKHGSVMPQIKTMRRLERCHVCLEPLNSVCPRTKSYATLAQRDTGEIKHRKPRVTVIEQEINECGCPTADVDDAGILAYARRGDERHRQVWAALMPTDILRPSGLVHLIPMFLTIHLVSSIPLSAGRFTWQKNQNVHLR